MSSKRGARSFSDVALAATLLWLWAFTPVVAPPQRLIYPHAPRAGVVDDYHGTRVADPYRTLEDLDAPATRTWVNAEAHLTRTYLGAIPERARIRARLEELYDFERTGIPFKAAGRYFFTSNSGHQ